MILNFITYLTINDKQLQIRVSNVYKTNSESLWHIQGVGVWRAGDGRVLKYPATAQVLHRVSPIHLEKRLQTTANNRWTVKNYRSPIIFKLVLTGIKSKRPIHISSQWPAIFLHAIFSRPALFRDRKSSDLLPKHFETVSKPQVEVLTTGKRSIYHRERCKNVLPYESTKAISSGVI